MEWNKHSNMVSLDNILFEHLNWSIQLNQISMEA